jgi:hypothetical protein
MKGIANRQKKTVTARKSFVREPPLKKHPAWSRKTLPDAKPKQRSKP